MRETEPLRPGYARRLPPSDTRSFADASPADSAVIDPEPVGNNYAEPALFASTIQEERRPGGLRMWFVAAFFLVLGIGVGFASGYRVGQGGTLFTTQDATPPAAEVPSSPAATETSGRTFSESSVGDPVHLEPETIVPAPQPAPAPVPAPAPAPRAEPRAQRPAPPAAAPSEPAASGPGTLQVVSRPAGAQVYLDGRLVGRTPFSIPVEAGAHSVRLELPEFNAWTTTVEVKAGGSLRVAASLEQ